MRLAATYLPVADGLAVTTARGAARRVGERRGLDWRRVIVSVVYGFLAVEILYFLFRPNGLWSFGLFFDGHTYLDAARAWLAGDGFYPLRQLEAPYPVLAREILYPPSMLLILVPFTFLPMVAFVAVPLAITAYIVHWHRPSYGGWLGIGLLLLYPASFGIFLFANPGMWVVAATALATRWPGWGPMVLLKPSLFPFAFIGIRHRQWWGTAALMAAFTVLTAPLWLEYARVLLNARGAGILYSLWHAVPMFVPIVARRWSTR